MSFILSMNNIKHLFHNEQH